jgi:hypothetical protein
MKQEDNLQGTEMLREYSFCRGVRGKYTLRDAGGSNVVVLSPEVTETFPNSASVNRALCTLSDTPCVSATA